MIKFRNGLNPNELAREGLEHGVTFLPLHYRKKRPSVKNWQDYRLTETKIDGDFKTSGQNIGLLLGEPSGGIVDVDLDCPEAVELADMLPKTASFGKSDTRISHCLYHINEPHRITTFTDPMVKKGDKDKAMLIELRGTGHQTMIPPSMHPNDGKLRWITEGEPAEANIDELKKKVGIVASMCLLIRYWPEGNRQNAALGLAGMLAKGGYEEDEATTMLSRICDMAGDVEELDMRLTAVSDTYKKLGSDKKLVGISKLKEVFDDKIVARITEWLGLSDNENRGMMEIFVEDGKFCKYANKNILTISSFHIVPLESIYEPEKGEFLKCKLIADGKEFTKTVSPDVWASQQKFLAFLPDRYFTSTATTRDIQGIRAYLSTFDIPSKRGTSVAGFIKGAFVTEDGAVTKDGKIDDLVFINGRKTNCQILRYEVISNEEIEGFKQYLTNFNSPEITHTLFGWLTACFYKPIFQKRYGAFPLLNIEGGKGSGKTSTITSVVMRLWGLDATPLNISQGTRFTMMLAVSGSNAIPVIYDENKAGRMSKGSINRISELIRSAYNANEGERGHANLTVTTYKYQAPVVISGETGFAEPAVLDRFVFVHFASNISKKYMDNFDKVRDVPMERLGRLLLNNALKTSEKDVIDIFEEEFEKVSPKIKERPRYNAAVVRTGLRIFASTIGMTMDGHNVDDSMLNSIFDEKQGSVVSKMLEAMGEMSSYTNDNMDGTPYYKYHYRDHLENKVHYFRKDNTLRIYGAAALALFYKWADAHSYDGDVLDRSTFYKQIRDEEYFIDAKNSPIGNAVRHCVILDINKMKKAGIAIPREWEG